MFLLTGYEPSLHPPAHPKCIGLDSVYAGAHLEERR